MSGRDADCGVDQFVREDRRDLRGHCVGRVREVGPDEDFKMPVRTQSVIPALADRLALASGAGETDRDADAVGQGGMQRVEQRGHADRHPVKPALSIVLLHVLSPSKIALGAMAFRHRPCLVANSGGEGGNGNLPGWCGRSEASHGPADCRCWGEGAALPFPILGSGERMVKIVR